MNLENKYCKATEENFEAILKTGIKLADDIFPDGNYIFIENGVMIFENENYKGSLDEEIHLINGAFKLV